MASVNNAAYTCLGQRHELSISLNFSALRLL
nr:MAG TPA: hypothetical protein [Bacteriophage sp.]